MYFGLEKIYIFLYIFIKNLYKFLEIFSNNTPELNYPIKSSYLKLTIPSLIILCFWQKYNYIKKYLKHNYVRNRMHLH